MQHERMRRVELIRTQVLSNTHLTGNSTWSRAHNNLCRILGHQHISGMQGFKSAARGDPVLGDHPLAPSAPSNQGCQGPSAAAPPDCHLIFGFPWCIQDCNESQRCLRMHPRLDLAEAGSGKRHSVALRHVAAICHSCKAFTEIEQTACTCPS